MLCRTSVPLAMKYSLQKFCWRQFMFGLYIGPVIIFLRIALPWLAYGLSDLLPRRNMILDFYFS